MSAKGSAEWQGELKSGDGTFTAGDSIGGECSFKSRFEDGPGANPEQLIAAAYAACFSMALAAALGDATFQAAARDAKEGCPVSRALAGVPDITLDASLA
jgi:osmotically inducible protein OsmC